MKRDCPQKTETKADRSEAPGKHSSKPTISTATVGVSEASLDPTPLFDGFSDEQLEAALTARRCSKEQSLLCNSEISTVIAQGNASAVGPTLVLEVSIEGVLVSSMVDTGSQCSIISRNMLQSIGKHLKGQGKDWPKLQPASAKLYGKDGKTGGHELDITAQITFTVEADGVSVPVLFFIQPDSTQPCLLGMNALPALGLSFLNAKGKPLQTVGQSIRISARVSLIDCKSNLFRFQWRNSDSDFSMDEIEVICLFSSIA